MAEEEDYIVRINVEEYVTLYPNLVANEEIILLDWCLTNNTNMNSVIPQSFDPEGVMVFFYVDKFIFSRLEAYEAQVNSNELADPNFFVEQYNFLYGEIAKMAEKPEYFKSKQEYITDFLQYYFLSETQQKNPEDVLAFINSNPLLYSSMTNHVEWTAVDLAPTPDKSEEMAARLTKLLDIVRAIANTREQFTISDVFYTNYTTELTFPLRQGSLFEFFDVVEADVFIPFLYVSTGEKQFYKFFNSFDAGILQGWLSELEEPKPETLIMHVHQTRFAQPVRPSDYTKVTIRYGNGVLTIVFETVNNEGISELADDALRHNILSRFEGLLRDVPATAKYQNIFVNFKISAAKQFRLTAPVLNHLVMTSSMFSSQFVPNDQFLTTKQFRRLSYVFNPQKKDAIFFRIRQQPRQFKRLHDVATSPEAEVEEEEEEAEGEAEDKGTKLKELYVYATRISSEASLQNLWRNLNLLFSTYIKEYKPIARDILTHVGTLSYKLLFRSEALVVQPSMTKTHLNPLRKIFPDLFPSVKYPRACVPERQPVLVSEEDLAAHPDEKERLEMGWYFYPPDKNGRWFGPADQRSVYRYVGLKKMDVAPGKSLLTLCLYKKNRATQNAQLLAAPVKSTGTRVPISVSSYTTQSDKIVTDRHSILPTMLRRWIDIYGEGTGADRFQRFSGPLSGDSILWVMRFATSAAVEFDQLREQLAAVAVAAKQEMYASSLTEIQNYIRTAEYLDVDNIIRALEVVLQVNILLFEQTLDGPNPEYVKFALPNYAYMHLAHKNPRLPVVLVIKQPTKNVDIPYQCAIVVDQNNMGTFMWPRMTMAYNNSVLRTYHDGAAYMFLPFFQEFSRPEQRFLQQIDTYGKVRGLALFRNDTGNRIFIETTALPIFYNKSVITLEDVKRDIENTADDIEYLVATFDRDFEIVQSDESMCVAILFGLSVIVTLGPRPGRVPVSGLRVEGMETFIRNQKIGSRLMQLALYEFSRLYRHRETLGRDELVERLERRMVSLPNHDYRPGLLEKRLKPADPFYTAQDRRGRRQLIVPDDATKEKLLRYVRWYAAARWQQLVSYATDVYVFDNAYQYQTDFNTFQERNVVCSTVNECEREIFHRNYIKTCYQVYLTVGPQIIVPVYFQHPFVENGALHILHPKFPSTTSAARYTERLFYGGQKVFSTAQNTLNMAQLTIYNFSTPELPTLQQVAAAVPVLKLIVVREYYYVLREV